MSGGGPGGGQGGGSGGRPPPQRTVIAPLPGRGAAAPTPQPSAYRSSDPSAQAGGVWAAADPAQPPGSPPSAAPFPAAPSGSGFPPPQPSGGSPRAAPFPPAAGQPPGPSESPRAQPFPPASPPASPPQASPPPAAAWGAPQGGGAFAPPPQGGGFPAGGFGGPQPGSQSGPQAAGAWLGPSNQERFFPDIARPDQRAAEPAPIPRIPLERALEGLSLGQAGAENPLLGAGAGLLILFGRLRSRVVDMEAMPLLNHVTHQIDGFERRAVEAGADPADAQVAKYVLCGTADDIVQNLPGTDREIWVQYSMEARFFHRRTSGVDVFRQIEAALADPARRYHLLELMLACLSLGFQGQYRTTSGGDVELQRWRRGIHEALRRVRAREDDDISPRWQGISAPTRYQRRQVPVWVILALAVAVLGGSYLALRMHLGDIAHAAAADLRGLHPPAPLSLVQISPPAPPDDTPPAPPPEPLVLDTPGMLERIRGALADDIEAGRLEVSQRGAYIVVSANNELMNFGLGSADIRADIGPIVARVAAALAAEERTVEVVGHTDSVPMSGRGRFRTNQELSEARAESVATVLRGALGEAVPMRVIGAGEDDPIADNATAEGRAENRRVEIRIRLAEN